MKANLVLTAAMALCLAVAPSAEALASVNETSTSTLAPAKKKTTKKSTKSTSKKKTTSKKSTKSKASKAAATSAANAQPAAAEAQTVATKAQAAEEKAQTTTKQQAASSGTGSLLGGILSAIGGGSSSSSDTAGDIISGLTSIFNSSKVATKDKLVGTWTYTEPAVVFSSNNALKNIGGKVASQTIENQLQSQFEKYGIKKGMMTMTFDKNGNFTQTVGSKSTSGTYTVSGKSVTLKYAGGIQQFVGTTQLDGNDLLIVMDASKLLKFANTIGSLTGNSLLKTAGSLVGSMDGMEVGLKLNK